MEDFTVIYKILDLLNKSNDLDSFGLEDISAKRLGVSDNRLLAILLMLLESGYIQGFAIEEDLAGRYLVSQGRPRITLKGLEYLNENSTMKKIYKALKGIKDITPGL